MTEFLFYTIGKSFGIPYGIKSPPGGIAQRRRGRWLPGQPAAGGESCVQDSFLMEGVQVLLILAVNQRTYSLRFRTNCAKM